MSKELRLNIRVDQELLDLFKGAAEGKGISLSNWVLRTLKESLPDENQPKIDIREHEARIEKLEKCLLELLERDDRLIGCGK